MSSKPDTIIKYLEKERGFDFSGYRHSMFERQLDQRLSKTESKTNQKYFSYLKTHPRELDNLVDALTINVSSFFRDPLAFDYLTCKILPGLISEKTISGDNLLRVWSAGCSAGEEPYSIAMGISELIKENNSFNLNIFATDIDEKILTQARDAAYPVQSLENIKYGYLKYFTKKGNLYYLKNKIKRLVEFSKYDLRDKKSFAPPESIFADFDIILCRNVLIYFNTQFQDKIFKKLYRSLRKDGYLVLGEAEAPSIKYQPYFEKANDCCHIYRKSA